MKNCRTARKLSQEEFADTLGISTHYLSDIERGVRVPKLDTFIKILNILEISADYMLQDSLVVGYKEKTGELQKLVNKLSSGNREIVYRYVKLLIESFKQW